MSAVFQLVLPAAFVAGLAGGVHCAGMCGGLVHALCTHGPRRATRHLVAYNAGRIASYSCAGALVGAIGELGLATRGVPLLQPLLFALASVMLVVLGASIGGTRAMVSRLESAGAWLWRWIQPWTRHVLPVTTLPRALGLGALWGWLPCGLVYAVLLSALALGSWWQGAAVMLAFGVGTLPNLLGIGVVSRRLAAAGGTTPLRRVAGVAVAAFGVYGLMHVMQPSNAYSDDLLCRFVPGLGAWLH